VFLGTDAVKFTTEPEAAAKEILPSATLKRRDNHVVCIVGGRHELFSRSDTELPVRCDPYAGFECLVDTFETTAPN
jgi:hypothetical protein